MPIETLLNGSGVALVTGRITRSTSNRLKSAELANATVAVKRAADASIVPDENVPPAPKRPRTGTAEPTAGHSSGSQLDADTVHELVSDVEGRIAVVEVDLRKLKRKGRKTMAEKARLAQLVRELRDLRTTKEECSAAMTTAPPLAELNAEKPFVVPAEPTQVPVASGSNVRLPDVEAPVASGSNVKLPDAPVEEDMEDDNEEEEVVVEKHVINEALANNYGIDTNVGKALDKLGMVGLYKPLPGMRVALMPHQAIGVAWMLEKEKSKLKGGCLADDMGLGKTVQMIAVMVLNRSKDPKCSANLILAPVALLSQWQLEIESKTSCGFKCLIYHGTNRPKSLKDLTKYDVVLTTYQTLAMEFFDTKGEEKKAAKKTKKWVSGDEASNVKPAKKARNKEQGLLFQTAWYRIIIDEAQNIRNKDTRASRSVTVLQSEYRWCLTGTPIVNSVSDAFGYLRFLRVPTWSDWSEFNHRVASFSKRHPDHATHQLQRILEDVLLRRKKDSTLDGRRLIDLPPKEVTVVKLQFTPEEREIYRMVEAKSQAIFNRFLRTGTVLKNYSQVLVLLLRLRQVCCHPCLIQEGGAAFVEMSALDEDASYDKQYELKRATRLVSVEFVQKMQAKFKKIALERIGAEKQSDDASIEIEECPVCYDAFTDPIVTPCGHVYCKRCMRTIWERAVPEENKKDERPCPVCRGVLTMQKVFARRAFEPTNAELGIQDAGSAGISDAEMLNALGAFTVSDDKAKGKGRALTKRKGRGRRDADPEDDAGANDEGDDSSGDYVAEHEGKEVKRVKEKRLGKRRAVAAPEADADDDVICGIQDAEEFQVKSKFLPSTKMKWMMESLRSWAEEHPDEKTIVISQWTGCLRLVSDYLTTNGLLHVKYEGDMKREKRDQSVRVFMTKDKVPIMLMSLKCGGVGLNLTRANRVISLDFGWSEAIESQAFDRAHRLGQTRPVFVHRLLIEDTVEERVLAAQGRKQAIADGSLGDSGGKKIARMSVRELAGLFGLNTRGDAL